MLRLRQTSKFLIAGSIFVSLPSFAFPSDPLSVEVLDLSLEELMKVSIQTASKREESLQEAPVASSVLTREQIKASGATSIPELLRLVPGVIVREQTNGSYDVHLRGLDYLPPQASLNFSANTTTLVMIDNRVVYSYLFGGVFWDTLPITVQDIERIEIVRGPSSALYGPNAGTGVIHIITKERKLKSSSGSRVEVSSLGGLGSDGKSSVHRERAGAFYTGEKFSLKLSAYNEQRSRPERYFSQSSGSYVNSALDFPQIPGGVDFWNPKKSLDAMGTNFLADIRPSDDTSAQLSAGYQDASSLVATYSNLTTPLLVRRSESFYVSSDISHKKLRLHSDYRQGNEGNIGFNRRNIEETDTWNAWVDYTLSAGGWAFTPSVQSLVVRSRMPNLSRLSPELETKDLVGRAASLKVEKTAFEKFRFVLAGRGDYYEHRGEWEPSYQGAVTYTLDNDQLLRASFGRAHRAPFMFDSYSAIVFPQFSLAQLGAKDLDLLTFESIELGYRGRLSQNVHLDVDLFTTEATNFSNITFQEGVPELVNINGQEYVVARYHNLPFKVRQIGVSPSLRWSPSKTFSMNAHVTYQESEIEGDILDGPLFGPAWTRRNVSGSHQHTPSWYGGVATDWSASEQVLLHLDLYYLDKQRTQSSRGVYQEVIDDNLLLNFNIRYQALEWCTLSGGVRSLTLAGKKQQFAFVDKISPLFTLAFEARW